MLGSYSLLAPRSLPGITAVLAKIGIEHINSSATAVRTGSSGLLWLMVFVGGFSEYS